MKTSAFVRRISVLLLSVILFVGCASNSNLNASLLVEGDLSYFAEMSPSERAARCEGKTVQISGVVSYVGNSLFYIGERMEGGITVVCYLSDATVSSFVEPGDYVTVRGTCTSCLETNMTIKDSRLIGTSEAPNTDGGETPCEKITEPVTDKTEEVTGGSDACETSGENISDPVGTNTDDSTDITDVEAMVWIPTNGGTKYHTKADCSNMRDPIRVTLAEAEEEGFTACKRCH